MSKRNSENKQGKLPGEYPAKEDIMNVKGLQKEGIDDESFTVANKREALAKEGPVKDDVVDDEQEEQEVASESDLTEEDFEALGPRDLSLDGGEDEQLKHRTWPVDFAARDLDVPGSELDDADEEVGSPDEENNSYSLGGDDKENLEDDPTRTFG